MLMRHPITEAVRRALDTTDDLSAISDFLFLEHWEFHSLHGAAAALRVMQIRRANPELAAELREEVARCSGKPGLSAEPSIVPQHLPDRDRGAANGPWTPRRAD
jgi:hypothetical protein